MATGHKYLKPAPAIIVAAGSGIRMKTPLRKQYLYLDDRPVLARTLNIFGACKAIDDIFLVIPEMDFTFCEKTIFPHCRFTERIQLVSGGRERQNSVYNGICAIDAERKFQFDEKLDASQEMIVIHDGVRPLITSVIIEACLSAAIHTGAAIVGVPASDTLKRVDRQGIITATLSRESTWLAQTPQCFRHDLIKTAHESALKQNFLGTDDASLVERMGIAVRVVPGSCYNIKITTPEDMVLARAILRAKNENINGNRARKRVPSPLMGEDQGGGENET